MGFAKLFCILHFKYILRTILPSSGYNYYCHRVPSHRSVLRWDSMRAKEAKVYHCLFHACNEETSQPEICQLGRQREWYGGYAVRADKDRKNLPASLSFALTEFAEWRCHLQSGLWLVSSICNISMGFLHGVKYVFHVIYLHHRKINCVRLEM